MHDALFRRPGGLPRGPLALHGLATPYDSRFSRNGRCTSLAKELISGCQLIDLDVKGDERGRLIALEEHRNVPFDVRRAYFIYGTQVGVSRGFHAHRRLRQLVTCVSGECRMLLNDGQRAIEVELDRPDRALLIAPMVWHEMHNFSSNCVMLVLADDFYDEADYIRCKDDFLAVARNG